MDDEGAGVDIEHEARRAFAESVEEAKGSLMVRIQPRVARGDGLVEAMGEGGSSGQGEEMAGEWKSLKWIMKVVRCG